MIDSNLPTARDWLSAPACVLSPTTSVQEAISRLVEHGVSAAPVVDGENRILGMLTEKDCLRILSAWVYDAEASSALATVADYQSEVKSPCEPGMDLFRVAELFLANNFPVLPVVAEGGRLLGTISRADMLRQIQDLQRKLDRHHAEFERGAGHQADRPRGIETMQKAVAGATSAEQLVRLFKRGG
ncbi:MAG: CBS domain-containing protein [Acidobacteriota bacterium]